MENILADVNTVVSELCKILVKSKWSKHATIVARKDECFPRKPVEIRYEVKGKVRTDRAAAEGLWMPDRLRDACSDLGDEHGAHVLCTADFEVEVHKVKAKHLLKPDVSDLLVRAGKNNVIVCWTSFHGDTDACLGSLGDAIRSKAIDTQKVRVVTIAMDEEPFAARMKATKSGIHELVECLWTGQDGWESKPARALGIEESAPTVFLFDENGCYVVSGDLEDVISALKAEEDTSKAGDDKANLESNLISDAVWKSLCRECTRMRMENKGRMVLTRRTICTWEDSSIVSNSPPIVRQRCIVSGEIFVDCAAEVHQAFRNIPSQLVWTTFLVNRPKPFNVSSACSVHSKAKGDYQCMVCDATMCEACDQTHDGKHPCLVLYGGHDLSRSLFGQGAVEFEQDMLDATSGNHPDLGCDACLSALPAKGLRFKNLAKDEHELCEKCFKESLTMQKSLNEKDFEAKFFCDKKDPFARMKTSRGVSFNRLAKSNPGRLDEDTKTTPQQEVSKSNVDVPCGHTPFSWFGTLTAGNCSDIPSGHTPFSWGVHQ